MVSTPTLSKTVAERLAVLRDRDGISQRELAEKSGVTLSVLNRAVLGTGTPSPDALCKLADYFEVSLDWLLGRVDGKPRRIKTSSLAAN